MIAEQNTKLDDKVTLNGVRCNLVISSGTEKTIVNSSGVATFNITGCPSTVMAVSVEVLGHVLANSGVGNGTMVITVPSAANTEIWAKYIVIGY